jgi:tetratricopeptide (TPR) repeat protein
MQYNQETCENRSSIRWKDKEVKMKKPKRYTSFSVSITRDSGLKSLRIEYAHVDLQKRRMAAQWEYDSAMASDLFGSALLKSGARTLPQPKWPPGFLALAIDPLFAPALLTVGSLEYQHGFVKEAMGLFLTLTKLPENEEDLAEIIDKACNFLLDHEDFKNALELYLAAERAYPTQALHYNGSGYCFYKLGNIGESIRKERRAVELEPDNYLYLNDLGYSLLTAGLLEEAETVLKRSISLAPPEYELARENLELLYETQKKP